MHKAFDELEALGWLRGPRSRLIACLAALERARAEGWVEAGERVLLFQTGAAAKYVEALACKLPRLSRSAPDWERVLAP